MRDEPACHQSMIEVCFGKGQRFACVSGKPLAQGKVFYCGSTFWMKPLESMIKSISGLSLIEAPTLKARQIFSGQIRQKMLPSAPGATKVL